MKSPKLTYVRTRSVAQTLELLSKHGDGANILAGGQSLMPTLNMRLSKPDLLIDINQLDELSGITVEGDMVRIGALSRHTAVLGSQIVAERLPMIAEAMPHVAHVAVRNRGTIGGSIALAAPAAELPACVVALDATITVDSVRGQRNIAAADFFKGLFETERQPDELLTEIRIPRQKPGTVHAFMELSRRQGDFAIAGVACAADIDGEIVTDAKLVYFASEDRPTLALNAAAAIVGRPWSEQSRSSAMAALSDDLDPMDNLQGSSAFKLHLQRVLSGRVLDQAIDRARAQ